MIGGKKIENSLMKSSLPYYLFLVVTILHININMKLKLPTIALFDLFALFPLLDLTIAKDWMNPTLKEVKELQHSTLFLLPLYLGLALDWLITIKYLKDFLTFNLFSQIIGLFLISLLFSTTFLIAHQLMHRNSKIARFIATLHQVKCLYMHFSISHVDIHHKDVATPQDPSSALKDESIYKFVPRSVVGSYKQAYRIKPKQVSFYTICYVIYLAVVYFIFDFKRVLISLVAAFGGVFFLEAINYIEHYGLRRKQLPDGTFQKINIRHSWNAPHRISNYFLFKLQRHSDHHENSLKPYQTLCSYQQSPQLPEGYLGSITMCFFPSIWFKVMNPLVDQYMSSSKALRGTDLKCVGEVNQNVQSFCKKRLFFFGSLVVFNLLVKFGDMFV